LVRLALFSWEGKTMNAVRRFLKEEDGPTAVEYAIMLALIVLGAVVAISSVGESMSGVFQSIGDRVGL